MPLPILLVPIHCMLFVLAFSPAVDGWNEEDEAKRIAQIKNDERRLYELQTGQKLPAFYETTSSEEESARQMGTAPGCDGIFHQIGDSEFTSGNTLSTRPLRPPSVEFQTTTINFSQSASNGFHWCFHCASPWHTLSEPMQRVVRNLLDVRRAQYPVSSEAITRDCVHPRDLDRLPRQICRGFSHCQTLVLTDHGAGSAFTIRGCAERFGAVEPEVLDRRKDNTCRRLHGAVDIQECICEKRKYCYAGSERAWTTRYTQMETWRGPLLGHGTAPAAAPLRDASGGGGRMHNKLALISAVLSFVILLFFTRIFR